MVDDIAITKSKGLSILMPLIGRLTCHVRQQMSQAFTQLGYDLTPEAADALMIIRHFDGLPQKKLAHILGKDKASITRLLNGLVKSKLVERIQDQQDRRVIRSHITNEGKNAFIKIHPACENINDNTLANISEQDFAAMTRVLSTVVGSLSCPTASEHVDTT